ncbi:Mlr7403 protein [plant metagenome]|uniref:Ancillary SecYEG translocon subunit n=2 Tax=root TaxID=1 RepID=A0A1C3K8P5_9BURK|nr:tetratricopeptide repeat protein [Orrella dioscoreae]SBT27834.1 Mlr7403 protein [Orrella dioscoreae]SOE49255.1 Mlr7403 protein [Orrella dioscoreae]
MAYDLDEQEKLDSLKAWWARYGLAVSAALLVVMASLAGWQGWRWYEAHRATQAMGYFEALQEAAGQQGDDAAARIKAASATLRDDFPGTPYAGRGALLAAHALAERKDVAGAREQLEWLAQAKDTTLQGVARLRLAGLLLDQKEYDAALAQLNDVPPGFAALYADRRGDVLAAQGKREEARAAWDSAVKSLEPGSPLTAALQLKIDALGGA